jgi:hypothetical protein
MWNILALTPTPCLCLFSPFQEFLHEIIYTSGRIKRLALVPLPPLAIVFPPFSIGSSSEDDATEDMHDKTSSEELMSRYAN